MDKWRKSGYTLSSLDNALKVLDVLSVRDNIGLAELSRITKLDKTSVFKMLYTLENRDYVSKTADAKYRLGSKFISYGSLLVARRSLVEIVGPYLRTLREQFHETFYLGELNTNGKVIITHMEAGDRPKSLITRIGFELEAHTNPMGKVLLAYLDDNMLRSLVEHMQFHAYTESTITSAEQLYPILEETRRQGFCIDRDERAMGVGAIAVPVFGKKGRCIATISVTCRVEVLEKRKEILLDALVHAADDISNHMAY